MAPKKSNEVAEKRVHSRIYVQVKVAQIYQANGFPKRVAKYLPDLDILGQPNVESATDPDLKNAAIDAELKLLADEIAEWREATKGQKALGFPYTVRAPIPARISIRVVTGDTLVPGQNIDPTLQASSAPRVPFQRQQGGQVCSLLLSSGGSQRRVHPGTGWRLCYSLQG